jgi:hypothetical protein
MNKIIVFLLFVFFASNVFCQEDLFDEIEEDDDKDQKMGLAVTLDLFTDIWQNEPDSITFGSVNIGFNYSIQPEFHLGKSNFSFAPGLSIGIHNLNSDAMISRDSNDNSYFSLIPSTYNGKTVDYKKNSISMTYLDIPIDLRFKAENDIFFSLGFKGGLLIGSSSYYKGDNYMHGREDEEIRYTLFNVHNIMSYRYGVTGRIGYKFAHLYVYYSLSNLFEEDKGPVDLYPISFGISLSP